LKIFAPLVTWSKTKNVIWLHFNYEILMDFVFFVQYAQEEYEGSP